MKMKPEHRKIIRDSVPFLVRDLVINVQFLSEFLPKKIFIDENVEEIMVSKYLIPDVAFSLLLSSY